MKKIILAIVGLAFAFVMSSCDEQQGKARKNSQKHSEKEQKGSRRW